MPFKQSLWDDSEPDYAPCERMIRGDAYWVAPKRYVALGYPTKTVRLPDGRDPALCRRLTRDMVTWYDAETRGEEPGTWAWLAERYLTDKDSDLHDVRPSTRASYLYEIGRIKNAIGAVALADTDFLTMKRWIREMRQDARSNHHIRSFFTHAGILLSYGIKIGDQDCPRIKAIRSEMRIPSGPRRSVFVTRDQVRQVVAEADRRGWPHVSLSILLRFELMLRGVDVYGQWVEANGMQGGIRQSGKLWVDGLTWDMISADCSCVTKQISKTRDSMPEPYVFDLTHLPDLRARLTAVPKDRRTGPVITAANGLPPKKGMIGKWFKQIVRDLGLPEDLQIRDSRAGGITEAKSLVDPYSLQHAAQHQNQNTTDRYARNRSDAANRVIEMRAKG